MIRKSILALTTVATFGFAGIDAAHAFNPGLVRKPNITRSETGRLKPAPIAYQLFCFQHASECRGGGASTVAYNATTMARLSEVNRSVNRSIRPKADGPENKWSLNPSAGDCEDYAITKRSRLIRAGFPASALRIADVTTGRGVRHAVLVVKTTAGDYVLDNMRGSILKRQYTGYKYHRMASADPRRWVDM